MTSREFLRLLFKFIIIFDLRLVYSTFKKCTIQRQVNLRDATAAVYLHCRPHRTSVFCRIYGNTWVPHTEHCLIWLSQSVRLQTHCALWCLCWHYFRLRCKPAWKDLKHAFAISASLDIPYFLLLRTEEYAHLHIFPQVPLLGDCYSRHNIKMHLTSYPGGDTTVCKEKREHHLFMAEQCPCHFELSKILRCYCSPITVYFSGVQLAMGKVFFFPGFKKSIYTIHFRERNFMQSVAILCWVCPTSRFPGPARPLAHRQC